MEKGFDSYLVRFLVRNRASRMAIIAPYHAFKKCDLSVETSEKAFTGGLFSVVPVLRSNSDRSLTVILNKLLAVFLQPEK